jgi:hypothetical protein
LGELVVGVGAPSVIQCAGLVEALDAVVEAVIRVGFDGQVEAAAAGKVNGRWRDGLGQPVEVVVLV